MPNQQGLSFIPSGMVLFIGLALLILTVTLCGLAWHRSGYRRGIGILELLRLVLVGLVIATLYQPEWLSEEPFEKLSNLVVLWDQSDSMKTKDVVDDTDISSPPKSRAETIAPLISESVWKSVDEGLNVIIEPFSSKLNPAESATDLHTGLSRVLDNHTNLRGVVVLSDGDWNEGKPPVEAATRFRMKGIPVFAVGVGSQVLLPDLELVRMDLPTFGILNKPLRIPFVLKSTLGQDHDISVVLSVNDKQTLSKTVRLPAMGQVQQDMIWTPPASGDYTLTMRLPADKQDLITDNNQISAPISIRQEELKVLVIENYPRWEFRYLRNALERDPGVEVTCLLFHPELSKMGGGRTYIKRFPAASELTRFDVVFLGDVGVGRNQLTIQQVKDLRQLVSAQAAGLVFMPGRRGKQRSLLSGPLADLYPVVMDNARPRGVGTRAAGHFVLTQSGQRSLLTRLEETDQDNSHIWRTLPGFHWYAAVQRAKAGSETLAMHDQEMTASGRVPLIVTKTYGTGKILFMGTDSAWRWREGIEDRYHYRFWGQVTRWMAYRRQMAQGQSIRLFFSPDNPRVDDMVSLNANVLDRVGGPLDQGTVMVQAISPSGKTETVRLQPGQEDAWGLFVGSFIPKEPGTYRLVVSCVETGASVQTDLSVQGLNRERKGRLARFDVLGEIASVTNGRLVSVPDVSLLLDDLAAIPEPEPIIQRARIWAHPLWAGFLILLLCLFWIGRKIVGTV